MTIDIGDPLGLLTAQNGISDTPEEEAAAAASSNLTSPQQAASIGEPVPIVFCRQVSGNGGVFVSPRATEARYENAESTNVLTVSLMLVLSEGSLPTLPIKDVFQGACRQGTWAQTYDRRAGTWTPGNAIGSTTLSGATTWNCPLYCGTSGRYENMTTLSYINTFDDADTRWNRQVHVFVRNGIQVTRILDDTLGPSNNFIDLALYLIRQSSQIAEDLIDTTGMTAAANFTNTNSFFYNGEFKESTNLESWLTTTGNYFLLRLIQSRGKYSFKPRVVVNTDHTINTGKVDFDFTFTEEHVLPNGFEIEYVSLSDRQDVAYDMMWRQQPDADIGFPRSTQVKYDNQADSGPYEQHDLSAFCTYEDHAVKIAAYKLARRRYVTHTLRIKVRPGTYNSSLEIGDICRVRLRRETAVDNPSFHDFMYEIERIEKTTSGVCVFTLTHFPTDDLQRSLVAREVARATGPGVTIAVGRSDYTCDENADDDDTALANQGIDYTAGSAPFDAPEIEDVTLEIAASTDPNDTVNNPLARDVQGDLEGQEAVRGTSFSSRFVDAPNNPTDPLEEDLEPLDVINEDPDPIVSGEISPGDTISISNGDFTCDGEVEWFRVHKDTGEITSISKQNAAVDNSYSLTITTSDIDHYIEATGRCKDPSTASGYGAPRYLGRTDIVPQNTRVYNNFIRLSADIGDTDEYLSYQGPAEISFGSKCIDCSGNTVDCAADIPRPTWVINNYYRTSETCTSRPNEGFAYKDPIAAAFCPVSVFWQNNYTTIPKVVDYELFRTDSC